MRWRRVCGEVVEGVRVCGDEVVVPLVKQSQAFLPVRAVHEIICNWPKLSPCWSV